MTNIMPKSEFPNLRRHQILTFAMYITGFIGLRIDATASYMKLFTPLHLAFMLLVVLRFHQDWSKSFLWFCGSVFAFGIVVEALGVATGQIFGEYHYGTTLGTSVFDVPLVIGANWLFLAYCVGIVTAELKIATWLKVILAALLMTLIDVITEPVAVQFDMWSWAGGQIPLQNYLAWFMVSLPIFAVFYALPFKKQNPIAFWLLLLNTLFFALGVFNS